jgi:hypothetical protein
MTQHFITRLRERGLTSATPNAYVAGIKLIEHDFGDLPLTPLEHRRMRGEKLA